MDRIAHFFGAPQKHIHRVPNNQIPPQVVPVEPPQPRVDEETILTLLNEVMEAIVGGALLSASMEMLVKKVVSGEFLDLFRRTKLDVDLLENLEITLLSLQFVLHDAEDKQIANPAVKKWLEMLQDAVFEADDLFDELNTQALRCQAEGGQVLNKFLSYFKRFNKKINSKLQKLFGRLEHLKNQNLGLKEESNKRIRFCCLQEVAG
ncbi:hypothetical protein RYX36_017227 [Vicia faba]